MSVFDQHKNGVAPQFADIEAQGEQMRAARQRIAKALADLDGDWIYPLAHYAAEERQSDEALRLLNGFSHRHAQHDDVVKNYVLAAEIMQRDFGQDADALQLLQRLAQQYAEHKDVALIQQLQSRLEAQ